MLYNLNNIDLSYKDGNCQIFALNKINLELPETGLIGIIGPSGSGKTSLLYIMSGIKTPTAGHVLYRGASLPHQTNLRNQLRRHEMGFVFQFHFLIGYLSVAQNIMVGFNGGAVDLIYMNNLMDELEISHIKNKKPYQISGGQRQRVAIARALANRPKVIFVDEPTSSLDHCTGRKIIALLKEASQNALVIVVTHDYENIRQVDKIIKVWDGQIVLDLNQNQKQYFEGSQQEIQHKGSAFHL
jgi:putative ABC transport system ATP-binding protein